jgi:hypothetical protein
MGWSALEAAIIKTVIKRVSLMKGEIRGWPSGDLKKVIMKF